MMNEKQDPGLMCNKGVVSKESQEKNEDQDPGLTLTQSTLPHRLPPLGLCSVSLSTFVCGGPDSSEERHKCF